MDGKYTIDTAYFTKMANFIGVPAISTPMGFDKNGLPIGIHFMAKWV